MLGEKDLIDFPSQAIAMHSNRTLVWGLDSPLMFELTKEVWANEESRNLVIGSRNFNCSAHGKDVLAGTSVS